MHCPVGRASQTPRLPPDARSETQSRPEASPVQGTSQTPTSRLCPSPHDPTHRVEHVVEHPGGTQLSGPATREVIDLPQVPAHNRHLPDPHLSLPTLGAQLDGVVIGDQRHQPDCGPGEEARLLAHHPVAGYRAWAELSLGAIVAATQQVAGKAQRVVADILEQVRGSPVVHADETGWRQEDTTATCGLSAPPTSGTDGTGARR